MMFGFGSSSPQPPNHHLFQLDEGENSDLRLNTGLKWYTSKLGVHDNKSNQLLKESLLDENPQGKIDEECKNSLRNKIIKPIPKNTKETYTADVVKGIIRDTISFNVDERHTLSSKFYSSILSQKVDINLNNTLIAKMEGNLLGSVFNIYIKHNNDFQLAGTITYESKISMKKLPRKISLYLSPSDQVIENFPNMKDAFQSGEKDIIKLQLPDKSFIPEKGKCLPLQKSKASIMASIHNTVFVDRTSNTIVLKLYKVSEEKYEVLFTHPMSLLMSYCFMLTSFSFKLISQ